MIEVWTEKVKLHSTYGSQEKARGKDHPEPFFYSGTGADPPPSPLLMEISFFMVPYIAEGNFPKLP